MVRTMWAGSDLVHKYKFVVTIITIINISACSYKLVLCVYVYYNASCYIPGLYDANKVPLGFLRHFLKYECVNFIENTSFKSSGDIY